MAGFRPLRPDLGCWQRSEQPRCTTVQGDYGLTRRSDGFLLALRTQEVAAMAAAVQAATPARLSVGRPTGARPAPNAGAIPTLTRWGLSPAADLVYRTLL